MSDPYSLALAIYPFDGRKTYALLKLIDQLENSTAPEKPKGDCPEPFCTEQFKTPVPADWGTKTGPLTEVKSAVLDPGQDSIPTVRIPDQTLRIAEEARQRLMDRIEKAALDGDAAELQRLGDQEMDQTVRAFYDQIRDSFKTPQVGHDTLQYLFAALDTLKELVDAPFPTPKWEQGLALNRINSALHRVQSHPELTGGIPDLEPLVQKAAELAARLTASLNGVA